MFLGETGFLEPARFVCLRAACSPKKEDSNNYVPEKICRKRNRLRGKIPRRETRKREKNAIEISMLEKVTPGGATAS